ALKEGAIMNTIGKILVILNLLFALVAVGFLVYDYTARTNWREAAEQNKRVAVVAESGRASAIQVMRDALKDKRTIQAALDSHLIESKAELEKFKIRLDNLQKELKEAKDRANEAVLNQDKALEEAKRRQKEVEVLQDVVRKREEEIAKAQTE